MFPGVWLRLGPIPLEMMNGSIDGIFTTCLNISPRADFKWSSRQSSMALNPTKHSRFYFPDRTVTFKVKDVLYNVHQHFFEHYSEVFATMFTLPPPAGVPVEGATDNNPIVLDNVEVRDFDLLLSIFYPTRFNKDDAQTIEEWSSILHLANRWEFVSVGERAIERLFTITTPIDKIVLGHAYDLRDWLLPAYADVCYRDDPPTLEEGRQLGLARHAVRNKGRICVRDEVEVIIDSILDPILPRPRPAPTRAPF